MPPTPTQRTLSFRGADFHVEVFGEGPPLLFLHGFTGVGSNWEPFLEHFAPHFQLVIPDLRGHGRSTNPSGEFTFRESADDMIQLCGQLGLGKISAVGASAGAKVLLHMAVRKPALLNRMVLVSAAPSFPPQARALMRETSIDLLGDEEWEMMRAWHVQGDDQIRMLWNQAAAFAESREDEIDEGRLRTITAEALIVHGDNDPFYPVDIPVALHHAIKRSYLWIAPNSGHTPIFLEPPERFGEQSLPFLLGEWSEA